MAHKCILGIVMLVGMDYYQYTRRRVQYFEKNTHKGEDETKE